MVFVGFWVRVVVVGDGMVVGRGVIKLELGKEGVVGG